MEDNEDGRFLVEFRPDDIMLALRASAAVLLDAAASLENLQSWCLVFRCFAATVKDHDAPSVFLVLVNLIVFKYRCGKIISPIDFAKTVVKLKTKLDDCSLNTHLDLDGTSMDELFAEVQATNFFTL